MLLVNFFPFFLNHSLQFQRNSILDGRGVCECECVGWGTGLGVWGVTKSE